MAPPIPASLDDVTPEWVTAALAPTFPALKVRSLTSDLLHAGTASTWRLHLEHESPAGAAAPDSVILKAGFGVAHSERLGESGLYRKEAMVYAEVLPGTAAATARAFAAAYDRDQPNAYVVLEDLALRGGRFCGPDRPLSRAQVEHGIGELAHLHASRWGDPSVLAPEWTHHGHPLSEDDPYVDRLTPMLPKLVRHVPHGGAVSHRFHDPALYDRLFAQLRRLDDQSAPCLIHGDAHVGNFFTDADGRPGMADFQCVQRGNPGHDLANFVTSALDVVDRRADERDLLAHYLDRLRALGIAAPTFEQLWASYRRHLVYALWAWIFTTDEFQPELHLVTNVYRFGTAAMDLDSVGAFDDTDDVPW